MGQIGPAFSLRGADQVARCLVELLEGANHPQRLVVLEILVELAVGCVVPTVAPGDLVFKTACEVSRSLTVVMALAEESRFNDERAWCLDILDCIRDIQPESKAEIDACLARLVGRGVEIPWFSGGSEK